jgi:hypothetical protein
MLTNTPQKFFRLNPHTKALYNKGQIDQEFQELLLKMMHPEFAQRPTLDEVESNSFLQANLVDLAKLQNLVKQHI